MSEGRGTARFRFAHLRGGAIAVGAALAAAVAVGAVVVSSGAVTHLALRPPKVHVGTVPKPPTVVVGALVVSHLKGLPFGDPVTPQGGWCSNGACWSTVVTKLGYVYPVRGATGAKQWHIAGPAVAGPGVSPADHYLAVDSRSSTTAVVWTGPDSFVTTHDGGRQWYRVTAITHHVAIDDVGTGVVNITIGLPGSGTCDYYFTYSSTAGTIWRRGGPLKNFKATSLVPLTPSCLETRRI